MICDRSKYENRIGDFRGVLGWGGTRAANGFVIGSFLALASGCGGGRPTAPAVQQEPECETHIQCPADHLCQKGKCEYAPKGREAYDAATEMTNDPLTCREWGESCLPSENICKPQTYECQDDKVCRKAGETCRFNWMQQDCCGQCMGNTRLETRCRSCAKEGAVCATIDLECRDVQACVEGKVCRKTGLLCLDDSQCCTGQCVGKFGDKWCSDCAGVGEFCNGDTEICEDMRLDCRGARVCVQLGEKCATDAECCASDDGVKSSCKQSAWHNHRTCHRDLKAA
jgi:hypothetical protein